MNKRTDKLAALQLAIKIEKQNLIERKARAEKDLIRINEESLLHAYIYGELKEIEKSIERCERWEK